MDPLTLAVSVARLASLTIQLVELTAKYSLGVKDAPGEVEALKLQLAALQSALTQLDNLLKGVVDKDIRFYADTGLRVALRHCERQLKGLWDKYSKENKGGSATNKRSKGKDFGKRLLWPFRKEEVEGTCQSLSQCVQAFQFFVAIDDSKVLVQNHSELLTNLKQQELALASVSKLTGGLSGQLGDTLSQLKDVQGVLKDGRAEIAASLSQLQDDNRSQEILVRDCVISCNGFRPTKYEKKHESVSSSRLAGTCEKKLRSSEVEAWISDNGVVGHQLRCLGDPGARKSVFCSAVINELIGRYSAAHYVAITYIYFDHQLRNEQTVLEAVRTLLAQLLGSSKRIPSEPERAFQKKERRPDLAETLTLLTDLMGDFRASYICVDALDECADAIAFLNVIKQLTTARLFITTRKPTKRIVKKALPGSIHIEVEADEQDVRALVNFRLVEDADPLGFLLPVLHIDNVLGHRTIKKRRDALEQLSGTIDDAYKTTILRIHDQGFQKADQALEILAWVLLAQRPLALTELRHAISIEIGAEDFNSEDLPSENMLTTCLGLVVTYQKRSTVGFMHFTLHEYLESSGQSLLGVGHEMLSRKCLTYMLYKSASVSLSSVAAPRMSFEEVEMLRHLTGIGTADEHGSEKYFTLRLAYSKTHHNAFELEVLQEMHGTFVLLKYVGQYWGEHFRNAEHMSTETEDLALRYLALLWNPLQPSIVDVGMRMVSPPKYTGLSPDLTAAPHLRWLCGPQPNVVRACKTNGQPYLLCRDRRKRNCNGYFGIDL
ncbi:Uu.00g112070.m01.CDS01 [Anthostomella pinea]|uniref:Uu.00g112070.m01.CDS01 n=1 Tax=Anthostomella pinea TaxID=933095 RepID=A0AAI8VF63_9PEZI|nr:Uu.00g112070.m01.CDS01 [Anthostomella pinea]